MPSLYIYDFVNFVFGRQIFVLYIIKKGQACTGCTVVYLHDGMILVTYATYPSKKSVSTQKNSSIGLILVAMKRWISGLDFSSYTRTTAML